MKRITARDHFRLMLPVILITAFMVLAVLLYVWAGKFVMTPFRVFFICSAFGLYLSPLIVLHLQYWFHNREMGVEFDGKIVRIYSNRMPVRNVSLNEAVEVEKNIPVPVSFTSLYTLPSSRYFIYYIWLTGERDPIILTSLLVGSSPVLDEIAKERETWIPYIDVGRRE